ncbi:MAG: RES domain-containing protein, partial [Acidimicrobiales bacterium]
MAPIYRVGYGPNLWAWVPWEYGPFTGRWDDPEGTYRVIYAGDSAMTCFVEVLARFRRDEALIADLETIEADGRDATYPTIEPGIVPTTWLEPRCLGMSNLDGTYAFVQHPESIAFLRPAFISLALSLKFADFDGAAIRASEPRALTQRLSRHLYLNDDPGVDGVVFESRHGNDLVLLGVFEKGGDPGMPEERSPLLTLEPTQPIDTGSPEFA